MRRNYRGNKAYETNMLGWYFNRGICDAVRYRNWRVSLNIVGVNSRILRTGLIRDRQWEARCNSY